MMVQFQSHLKLLEKLRDYNTQHNITLTADVLASGGNLMNNMLERLEIDLDSQIIDLDLIHLRPLGPYKDM